MRLLRRFLSIRCGEVFRIVSLLLPFFHQVGIRPSSNQSIWILWNGLVDLFGSGRRDICWVILASAQSEHLAVEGPRILTPRVCFPSYEKAAGPMYPVPEIRVRPWSLCPRFWLPYAFRCCKYGRKLILFDDILTMRFPSIPNRISSKSNLSISVVPINLTTFQTVEWG